MWNAWRCESCAAIALQRLTAEIDRRHPAIRDGRPNLRDAVRAPHEPRTRGTFTRPRARSASGACVRMRSRSSDGCSSSALSGASAAGTAMCAVGGTPEVSICWSCSAYARMLASCSAKRETSDCGEIEARERGDALDVGACQAVGHATDGTPMNRTAAVAGTWYPGTAGALAREVDQYLGAVGVVPSGRIDAIIVPHAGIMFSGPVAAHAYRAAASAGPYDAALLVGPSHFVAFDGVALYPSGAFECPLGPAIIDEALAAELISPSSVIRPLPTAHSREHSLEMQLPFLKRRAAGSGHRAVAHRLPDAPTRSSSSPRPWRTSRRRGGCCSSRAATCRTISTRTRQHVSTSACRIVWRHSTRTGCSALFEQYPEGERGRYVACGGGAIIAVMMAAKARGAKAARVLKYAHSGDVSGDNSGVVGYLAGACGDFLDAH